MIVKFAGKTWVEVHNAFNGLDGVYVDVDAMEMENAINGLIQGKYNFIRFEDSDKSSESFGISNIAMRNYMVARERFYPLFSGNPENITTIVHIDFIYNKMVPGKLKLTKISKTL